MTKFKIGDKVKIIKQPDNQFPKIGTIGTIQKIEKTAPYPYRIIFKNNEANVYKESEVKLMKKSKFKVFNI